MMILRSSSASPFGRKVKIALALLGLKDKVEVVAADTSNPSNPDIALHQQNPLGKIPTLVLESGKTIYDSRVILDYLDHLAGGGKIIPTDGARYDVLVQQATADGLMDAALLQVYEGRYRAPDKQEPKWVAMQSGKVDRVMTRWEASPPDLPEQPHVGTIATACALGYLDLRFAGNWRKDYPKMVAWLDAFAAKVSSFEETRFKG